MLVSSGTLFITDDIIVDKSLDKHKQSLLGLAISGRHCNHYLWLLIQSLLAIPRNLRRQTRAIFIWYPKERVDVKMMHDENNVLPDDGLVIVRDL